MAARLRPRHQDEIRHKIQASQIINRLTDHIHGKIELSATQVSAALGLLRKAIPDLAAVDHSGDVTLHSFAVPLTDATMTEAPQWERQTVN